jgi:phosphatidylglycerol---prolipoprotein diacylglyceryl transferase
MLPYVHVADLNILGFRLHPFGLLVVAAITVGTALARWRARRRGLDLDEVESCIGWMLALGFPSAHILDALLYHPREVLERPWALLFLWEGMGSFSGFIGALAGVVLWRRFEWRPARSFGPWRIGPLAIGPFALSRLVRRNVTLPILPYADLILSVFPVAWIFGRTGCSIAHDHPGARAPDGATLAIAFPSTNPSVVDGPGAHGTFGPITVIQGHFARYDLGTLELLLTIGIALAFVLLWRRRMVTGAYVVIVSLVYAPARFAMDFLRIEGTPGADPRYGGLTPAQWLCGALFVFGLVLLRRVVLVERRAVAP